MKHSIRSRTVDPIRGHVTRVEKVFGQLGSSVLDKHGREIFEGDLIRFERNTLVVKFNRGCHFVDVEVFGGDIFASRPLSVFHYGEG